MRLASFAALFALAAAAPTAHAAIISANLSDFSSATVEAFNGSTVTTTSYDFGNGMKYAGTNGDLINYASGYGMASEPSVSGGRGGSGGYFGTVATTTTFSFVFESGIEAFGFYGAESRVTPSDARDGVLDIDFYDLNGNLLGSLDVTTAGTFAWDQFHGFASDGALIRKVTFSNVGHMVLDDIHFNAGTTQPIPEPAALALSAIALAGLGAARRRKAA
jgi:PEP-CTERM motif